MSSTPADAAELRRPSAGPLAGQRAWIITDGKAGMDAQAKGVAEALGLQYEMKRVEPKGIWSLLAPWGPVAPTERFGSAGSQFAPPWPAVAIATGRASIPYMRALRRKAGIQTYTIVLQDPKTGTRTADLIWVPQHDRLRGPNVVTTPTSPHPFSPDRLRELRQALPPDIAAMPRPIVSVILGGKNGSYKFRDEDDDRLQHSLRSIGRLGASFLITTSRRTHGRLLRVVDAATADRPRVLWTGEGANPYPYFLAAADWLIVTADSVNMTGEALATGRPVYVFEPGGGSAKFRRFHDALNGLGGTRKLPDTLARLEEWSYQPIDSAAVIAREVERRVARRARMVSGPAGNAGG